MSLRRADRDGVPRSENGETQARVGRTPRVTVRLDPGPCYRALRARDPRFDGLFFVAVTTTGIYCRPICPARIPAADRCLFFAGAAEAERAGFRACFRCRPELAPGNGVASGAAEGAPVDALGRLVRAAAARIEAGYLNEGSVDELAHELGVTSRHLRRAMEATLGVTPIELAQTKRLALAKQLLHDTRLPLTAVALAAGFASVRRFNALFRARFGRPPSALRSESAARPRAPREDVIALRLDYRPPLDWEALLGFLAGRVVAGVEQVRDGEYARVVTLGGPIGWVTVRRDERRPALRAEVSLSLASVLPEVVTRLRALFDLDAQPAVIAQHLAQDPLLEPLVRARPGLRVPGAFDGFEVAVRAVLGQQVSVAAATTLSRRLVDRFGEPRAAALVAGPASLERTFPSAARLARTTVDEVASLGVPAARARSLIELAGAVARGDLTLDRHGSPHLTIEQLVALPGIGPWTAHYIALRALRWPDAFPAADLGVRKALGVTTVRAAEQRAAAWQPWRAYAVMHLWTSLSTGG